MDAVEEVKSHLDIVDIVGEYLQLKPAGMGSFRACCPFHQEKTPSFFVNKPRQSYHCFGCSKHGDIIGFVMEMEGMDFKDALALLATKAGIQLPEFNTQASGVKKRLVEVNELAARFFRTQLLQSAHAEHARTYVAKRGIDDVTGDLFKIGYAPQSWDALTQALMTKGVQAKELIDAGLVATRQSGGGVYDRFRDRLMFAIQDIHGHVVGFTGRLLDPSAKEAKYVNTPETQIYKKSSLLYALDKAKGDIKTHDLCVVVEGNMDALSSHRIGIQNVVASSGTALTKEQLKLIQRFTKSIAIAFDQDAAGTEATLRGLDLARAEDFTIRIITIPEGAGKDPDDLIQKDPNLWKEAIEKSMDIIDWIFASAFRGKDLSNPKEKRDIATLVLPEIARIHNPIVRDHWIKKLSEGLGTDIDALRGELKKQPPSRKSEPINQSTQAEHPIQPQFTRERDLGERIIELLLLRPDFTRLVPAGFADKLPEDLRHLYKSLEQTYHADHSTEARPTEVNTTPPHNFESLLNYLTVKADRDYPNQTTDILTSDFTSSINAYELLFRSEERKRLEEAMRQAELTGDRVSIERIMARFNELT